MWRAAQIAGTGGVAGCSRRIYLARPPRPTRFVRSPGFDGLGFAAATTRPRSDIENLSIARRDLMSEQGQGRRHHHAAGSCCRGSPSARPRMAKRSVSRRGRRHRAITCRSTGFEHNGTALRDLTAAAARRDWAQMSVRPPKPRVAACSDAAAALPPKRSRRAPPNAPLVRALEPARPRLEAGASKSPEPRAQSVRRRRLLPSDGRARPSSACSADGGAARLVMAPTVDHLDDFIGKAAHPACRLF